MNPTKVDSFDEKDPNGLIDTDIQPVGHALESETLILTDEDDRRIRRRVDWNLMPMLGVVVGWNFLDKICMSYASVMGFQQDANLSPSQYSWLGSIVYLGYLVGEYPLAFCLQRYRIAKITGTCVILWGAVLAFMALATNFKGLMALRFLLGVLESVVVPAINMFMTQYYKAGEQGTRTGVWMSANSFAPIVGASIAYGLYTADTKGQLALAGWRLVYIILGCATSFTGILFLIFIPDTPAGARFLTPSDRKLAVERIRSSQQGVINHEWRFNQVKEAFRDPFTWMYAAVSLLSCIPNGGITNFLSILIRGFGFTTSQTLLLGMVNAYHGLVYIGFLWLGDKWKRRCLVTVIPSSISTIGIAMVWGLPADQRIARLLGFYMSFPFIIAYAVALSLLTTNVVGYTKKTTVTAIFFVAYCVGNLIGPQTFRAQYAPRYAPALATIVVCNTLISVLLVALHFLYKRENAKRDKAAAEGRAEDMTGREFDDLTDRENPAFRYTL